MAKFTNIVRGTTDPGDWLSFLIYLYSLFSLHNLEITQDMKSIPWVVVPLAMFRVWLPSIGNWLLLKILILYLALCSPSLNPGLPVPPRPRTATEKFSIFMMDAGCGRKWSCGTRKPPWHDLSSAVDNRGKVMSHGANKLQMLFLTFSF